MKKCLSLFLTLILAVSLCAGLSVSAEGETTVLAFKVTFDKPAGQPDKPAFCIPSIGEINYTIVKTDYLEFDVKVVQSAENVAIGNIDFSMAPGGQLKDNESVRDNDGKRITATDDLSAVSNGQWVHRKIALTAVGGSKLSTFWLQAAAIDPNLASKGTVEAYFANVRFVDKDGNTSLSVFEGEKDKAKFQSTMNTDNNSNGVNGKDVPQFVSDMKLEFKTDKVAYPTEAPTKAPTQAPTKAPTEAATGAPTTAKTEAATNASTAESTTAATDASSKADESDSSFPLVPVIVAVAVVVVVAGGVIGYVLYKKKKDGTNGGSSDDDTTTPPTEE